MLNIGLDHPFQEWNLPGRVSTVLFDLDDTLMDSFPARVEALRQVFSTAGIPLGAESFLQDNRGIPLWQALTRLEGDGGTHLKLMEKYRRAYWLKGTKASGLYLGIEYVLKKLHASGLALGVVTQKRRAFDMDGRCVGAQQELLQLGVAHLTSAVVGLEDVERPKPDPEGVRLALRRLSAHPQETFVVGDAATDIEAANAAGCWSCYATWGVPVEERATAKTKAHFTAESPEALLQFTRQN